jgi:hypothetical protein
MHEKRNNIITLSIKLVLSASILIWLISSLKEVERKETKIDHLSSGLYVIQMLLPESAEITLSTNMDDAHETELLGQTQFVLAPRLILLDQSAPYILLIEDPSLKGKKIENSRQICSIHKGNLIYTLLRKKN